MNLRISHKLFIALTLTISVVVLAMVLLMKWSLDRGFLSYVNQTEARQLEQLAERLKTSYSEQGSWQFLLDDRKTWREISGRQLRHPPGPDDIARPREQRRPPPPRMHEPGRPPPPHSDYRQRPPPPPEYRRPPPPASPGQFDIGPRLSLLDAEMNHIAGRRQIPENASTIAIEIEGETIGWLRLAPLQKLEEQLELQFVKEQNRSFSIIALLSIFIAAVAAFIIARQFQSPIQQLAHATRALRGGDLDIRLANNRNDELGELMADFNQLANTLTENERLRRQWVMDIAHELRTPLTILRGEIEALQDGVRQWNEGVGKSLRAEVIRLSKLVDDLYELSLADAGKLRYEMTELDVIALLKNVIHNYHGSLKKKNIHISHHCDDRMKKIISADSDRLVQLFTNLLENSVRYTNSGGNIEIRCSNRDGQIKIEFHDSEPAVPDEALKDLFNRLFRVDESRNRAHGGAGIGLSMCKRIVLDHDGSIAAAHSPLGGLAIIIELPLMQK